MSGSVDDQSMMSASEEDSSSSESEHQESEDEDVNERLRERLKEMVAMRKDLEEEGSDAEFISTQIDQLVQFMEEHSICLGIEMMRPQAGLVSSPGEAAEEVVTPTGVTGVSNAIVQFVARVTKRRRKETQDVLDSSDMDDGDSESETDSKDEEAPNKKRGRAKSPATIEAGQKLTID